MFVKKAHFSFKADVLYTILLWIKINRMCIATEIFKLDILYRCFLTTVLCCEISLTNVLCTFTTEIIFITTKLENV